MTRSPTYAIVIENLPGIAAAYSEGVAGRVLGEVWRRFEEVLGTQSWTSVPEPWGVRVTYSGTNRSGLDLRELEAAIQAATRELIFNGSSIIVVSLTIRSGENIGSMAPPLHVDTTQFRLDMAAASMAYDALNVGELNFARQPVVGREEGGFALYHECLCRLSGADGSVFMPAVYLGALERLRLTRAFDWSVARSVITMLRREPEAVLGCNISGLSVANDVWWCSVLDELRRSPDIASRLVVEVTETALPQDTGSALEFIRALQATGCRIALDDFGGGLSTIAFARAAKADIVKVDGSLVRQCLAGSEGDRLLHHVVSLAGDFAADVVVEGIESAADLDIAQDAGARWFQGYYFRSLSVPATPPRPSPFPPRALEGFGVMQ